MDAIKFRKQIARLEAGYLHTLDEAFVPFWQKEIAEAGYSELDLTEGVTLLLRSTVELAGKWHTFVSLNALIRACAQARSNRVAPGLAAWQKHQKDFEQESTTGLVARGEKHKDPDVRELSANTLDLLYERIDYSLWEKKHADIFARYGKKVPDLRPRKGEFVKS